MFRCSECNAEYKYKPEYCDCGNNTFDEIPDQIQTPQTVNINAGQIISILIFVLCLLLAIMPWTLPEKTKSSENKNIKLEKSETQIPDIEKIWNNASIKQEPEMIFEKPKPIPEPQAVKVIQNQPKINETVKRKQAAPKPQKQQKQVSPPVQKTTKTELPKQTQTTIPKQQTVIKKTEPVVEKPVMDKTAFENYKNGLRLALLSKLDLVKINGEGECAIKFSVSESGKLLNRGFLYQSNNKSVNDQVYYMLMRVPSYKNPPKGYNGEVIKLKFYINNGYYEISFL